MTGNPNISSPIGSEAAPAAGARPGGTLWPTVLGVVSMVMGAEAILGSGGRAGARHLYRVLEGTFDWSDINQVLILPAEGLLTAAPAMLVAGGYLLWRRRRGVRLHVIYAVLTVALAIALPFLRQWSYMAGFGRWSAVDRSSLYWGLGRALMAPAYPVFLLVWFGRRKIRDQLRGWRRDPASAAAGRPAGTVWPEALGAVSMILGGKLLFWGLWSQTYPLWRGLFRLEWSLTASQVLLNALVSALGVLLMAAGWLLWRRRRGAAACHLIYAVSMMMLATACCCAFTLSAWSRWGWMSGLSGRYFSGRMVGSSLLELAFPVFLLAWFTRPKLRGQVRSWSRPGRRTGLPWPEK